MLKRAHCFAVASCALAAALVSLAAALGASGCQSTCVSTSDCGDKSYCSTAVGICLSPQALGFCKDVPTTHSNAVVPVCGCDGKTYTNQTEAAFARVSIAAMSPCSTSCGGPAKLACADKATYCHFMDGICGVGNAIGACDPVPTSCAGAPPAVVCGCDGKTYNSLCEAQAAGTSVASMGACTFACGGATNAKCDMGKFCQFAAGACSMPSPSGTCTPPPAACTPVSSPVCGCDGKSYGNACYAAQAQQSVFSTGLCPCGGPGALKCQPSEFCDYAMTGMCLSPNATGTCQPKPATCSGVPSPVCGCDFLPYTNACEAAKMGGVSVALLGMCPPGGPDAGADGG